MVRVSFLFDRPIPRFIIFHIQEELYGIAPLQKKLPNGKWELNVLCRDYRVPSIVDYAKKQEGYLSTVV